MKCPFHPIDIPADREVVLCDGLRHEWHGDAKGYFLVKLENGLLCCGFVNPEHRMVVEFRGKDPDRMIGEIARRELCSLGNMGYIASELMIAAAALKSGKKYVQR
jgi:hypothetical protein